MGSFFQENPNVESSFQNPDGLSPRFIYDMTQESAYRFYFINFEPEICQLPKSLFKLIEIIYFVYPFVIFKHPIDDTL